MAYPPGQVQLMMRDGSPIEIESIVEELRKQPERVLADDEVGVILYVGDLEVYKLTPTPTGEVLAQHVTEISRPRFSTGILRRQIGATVMDITSDAPFVIRDGERLRKVRAEDLKPGMVLSSGDKVYR